MKKKYIVFTDLDGTLLNHGDYSFEPALEALELIKLASIPLILTTSKTFSEVVKLQNKLGIKEPFIVENGAGIFIPRECVLAKTLPYKEDWTEVSDAHSYIELRLFFTNMQRQYPIRGFADMKAEEVIELTGLDKECTLDAIKRDFTEPFIIEDSSLIPSLREKANAEGLDIVQGGRFFHLISLHQDKAKAMLHLTHLYDEFYNEEHSTIALGDSANDFTMLHAADIGVLIPLYAGSFSKIDNPQKIKKAKFAGPKGWNEAIKELLNVK